MVPVGDAVAGAAEHEGLEADAALGDVLDGLLGEPQAAREVEVREAALPRGAAVDRLLAAPSLALGQRLDSPNQ